MATVPALIAAHTRGDARSLQALALALSALLADTPEVPVDPVAALVEGETSGEHPGTWQQVRAAADFGDLSPAEYEYLAAAVEALTQEDA
jgi:hypothetical protein